jgi:hypothetical protein
MVVVEREPAASHGHGRLAPHQQRIVGIEHQQPIRRQCTGDGEFDLGEVVEVVDPVLAEMVRADVGDDRDTRVVDRDATPQQTAARRLRIAASTSVWRSTVRAPTGPE